MKSRTYTQLLFCYNLCTFRNTALRLTLEHFNKKFELYRNSIYFEVCSYLDGLATIRQIHDSTKNYLSALNLAPEFFHVTEELAKWHVMLWLDKLLDRSGQCGIWNFLSFVEINCLWLSTEQLKSRRGYGKDHPALVDRKGPTFATVKAHRDKLEALSDLASRVRIIRDGYVGHFDKKFFFKRSDLWHVSGIDFNELDAAGSVFTEIINFYSVDYDCVQLGWNTHNDLVQLFQVANKKDL